jgi:large subunit ribosomal protein L24
MLFNQPKVERKVHVKKGDKVVVTSGQYKSNEIREVLKVQADGRVIVQGVNLRWKHQKRSQQNPKGGRVQLELPIDASKVLLWSEKLGKGTRTKIQVVNGKKARIGVRCGTNFDAADKK